MDIPPLQEVSRYFQHWWAGDAAEFYDARWISLAQANKLCNVGQFVFGWLALFELLSFSEIMSKLRAVTFVTARLSYLWWFLLNIPRFLLTLVLTLIFVASGMIVWPGFRETLRRHVEESAHAATEVASRFMLVRLFTWLQSHPVPERVIRATSFVVFAILTALQIITDV